VIAAAKYTEEAVFAQYCYFSILLHKGITLDIQFHLKCNFIHNKLTLKLKSNCTKVSAELGHPQVPVPLLKLL
jgi:hypothetical protein